MNEIGGGGRAEYKKTCTKQQCSFSVYRVISDRKKPCDPRTPRSNLVLLGTVQRPQHKYLLEHRPSKIKTPTEDSGRTAGGDILHLDFVGGYLTALLSRPAKLCTKKHEFHHP